MITRNAKSIFLHAIEEIPPSEWLGYVQNVCGDDKALQQEVNQLLAAHRQESDLADEAGELRDSALLTIARCDSVPIGTYIGPYKLCEQLGEGGMGVVYVAEQTEPVRRKVALKIIKPGMATKDVLARFDAERQALAMMDHPNIARVLDGGATAAGQPYFVMELVLGTTITKFSDDQKLTTRERLQLVIDVCRAVQHAHQKGVIHRDIKPSNILVAEIDGAPVPKVIDFGVAKAVSQKLSEQTVYTQVSQTVGTPLYMSPEQACMGVFDIDTRSDVYSLGVLLYELLTGSTPFDRETLKQVGIDELRRMIREDEPPRPSTAVSTLNAQALSTVAAHRGSGPRQLCDSLRGELDWLVMKALEKDRNRRYESASALATDVQRYIENKPVEACPPTRLYRLRKLTTRHKAGLTTAMAIALSLLIGSTISVWQAIQAADARSIAENRLVTANQQRTRAESNLVRAQRALDELYLMVTDQWKLRYDRDTHTKQEAVQKLIDYYQDVIQQDVSRPDLIASKAKSLRRLADLQHRSSGHHRQVFTYGGFGNLSRVQEETEIHRSALAILHDLVARFPEEPKYRVNLATTHLWIRGEDNCLKAIGLMEDLVADTVVNTASRSGTEDHYHGGVYLDWDCGCFGHYLLILADAHLSRGVHLLAGGKLDEAERSLRRAAKLWQTASQEHPEVAWHHWGLANTQFTLGMVLEAADQDEDAAECFGYADSAYRHTLELKPQSINSYVNFLLHVGRADDAVRTCRQATERFPADPSIYEVLGMAHGAQRQWQDAYRAVLKAWELNPEPGSLNDLALYLANFPGFDFHNPEKALELVQQLFELAGEDDYMAWSLLGQARFHQGDSLGAIEALEKAVELGHPYRARNAFLLSMAHLKAGNEQLARQHYEEGRTMFSRYRRTGASIPTEYFREQAEQLLETSRKDQEYDGQSAYSGP